MKKRQSPVIVRFPGIRKNKEPIKYYLSEIMRYIPFRDEVKEIWQYKDLDSCMNLYNRYK